MIIITSTVRAGWRGREGERGREREREGESPRLGRLRISTLQSRASGKYRDIGREREREREKEGERERER